jgi:hypothetical protein
MVNGLTIIIERVKWRVIHGEFLTQTNGYNCGPIACFKLMELFQQIDLESSQKCYEKCRIRAIVLDEWKLLVDTCDKDQKLQVLDTRTEDTSVPKSEHSILDYGDSSDSSYVEEANENDSSTELLSEIDFLSINNENGSFFRPDCSSMCITNSHSHDHPCNKGHKNVLHASLSYSRDFVIFPARTFH